MDVALVLTGNEYLMSLSYVLSGKNVSKRLQRLKQEWQKSPAGTRQTDGKNSVWFGEIERILAKLLKTTFAYRSSS
jgi:hypothetical protein